MNTLIQSPQVRLVDDEGEKVGVVPLEVALAKAQDAGVDLVEVAPNANPPVCRIMDYNKLQYEKQRKQKEAKKNQRHTETKEVKLRPNIDEHDYQTKLSHLRDFLSKGNRCKVSLMFRARELRRYDVGRSVVERMLQDVKDISQVDSRPNNQGRTIQALLSPSKDVLAEVDRQHKEELKEKKKEHDKKLAQKHQKDESGESEENQ